MPISCNSSALTGQEGSIYFQPAGTMFCLLDYTDFPAGTSITVPTTNDYVVGDPVTFAGIDFGFSKIGDLLELFFLFKPELSPPFIS